jgi:predicted aspartyl protease
MAHPPRVTSTVYPYLEVRVAIRGQQVGGLVAMLDTGFTGHLAIPATAFSGSLGVPDAVVDWELGDASVIHAPVYFGHVEIVGLARVPAAITLPGNEPLLGRGVLDRFRVTFDRGWQVIVER